MTGVTGLSGLDNHVNLVNPVRRIPANGGESFLAREKFAMSANCQKLHKLHKLQNKILTIKKSNMIHMCVVGRVLSRWRDGSDSLKKWNVFMALLSHN